jgi:hypothetical protein
MTKPYCTNLYNKDDLQWQMNSGVKMASNCVECDSWVLRRKLEGNSEEISSVALLSPACFDILFYNVINIWLKITNNCPIFEIIFWIKKKESVHLKKSSFLTGQISLKLRCFFKQACFWCLAEKFAQLYLVNINISIISQKHNLPYIIWSEHCHRI